MNHLHDDPAPNSEQSLNNFQSNLRGIGFALRYLKKQSFLRIGAGQVK
ncbi:MAG: hypothetical protein UV01_C0009G0025 [Parcubacteria group bacterium GW2011_GWA2_42_14]|nr:MAG: hypothetical protein UV01_C0009G0025 [Parcubacteria group bacterium GW2011_GWA2_42_14]